MNDSLPVFLTLYAGGRAVAGGINASIGTGTGYMNSWNLPTGDSWRCYNLQSMCKGTAGPEGWLLYELTLTDEVGALLGAACVPMLLWSRPWPVPNVVHFPPRHVAQPVYTASLRVLGPVTLHPVYDPQEVPA